MFTNINDFTTNGFVAALRNNTDLIYNGLTASEMFANAGINLVSARNSTEGVVKSEEKKMKVDYRVDFNDFWYPLVNWAFANWSSVVPATAKFAQQIVSRFGVINFVDLTHLSSIVPPSARVFSNTSIANYNFVPNLIGSIIDTSLYNRTFVVATPSKFTARLHADFAGTDIVIGVWDSNFVFVEDFSGTINSEGFVDLTYDPAGIVTGGTYYFAVRTFNIFNKFVPGVGGIEGLVANITAKQFFHQTL